VGTLSTQLSVGLPADKPGEPSRGRRVQPGPAGTSADHLVNVDGGLQPLHRHRPEGFHLDVAFRQPQRVRGEPDGAGRGELLHPGGQVRRLAHGGVVHAEVTADGADHDLPRVQAHADLELHPMRVPHLLGVASHRGLHVVGRVTGPHRVVLVRDRRPEERHDPVAHHLIHGAFVAVDGLHHPLEDGIEELPGFLRVAVGEQLHGPLQVGKEHGDLVCARPRGRPSRSGSSRRGAWGCRSRDWACVQRAALWWERRTSHRISFPAQVLRHTANRSV
jgi:hypothetical protein